MSAQPRTEQCPSLTPPVCVECKQVVLPMCTQPTYGREFSPEEIVERMVKQVADMGWWDLLHERLAQHPEHQLRNVA